MNNGNSFPAMININYLMTIKIDILKTLFCGMVLKRLKEEPGLALINTACIIYTSNSEENQCILS